MADSPTKLLSDAPAHHAPCMSSPQSLMEELHAPGDAMEVDFNDNMSTSALNMDNMDWLDLTLSVPAEEGHSLDVSVPVGVFSSDFLDSSELHLNWD
uniref:Uncharacterized protein n=1 Tax=Neolamprologus brichardi TaxID=32507 RepID=A0A3Q4MU49_NEOBR